MRLGDLAFGESFGALAEGSNEWVDGLQGAAIYQGMSELMVRLPEYPFHLVHSIFRLAEKKLPQSLRVELLALETNANSGISIEARPY